MSCCRQGQISFLFDGPGVFYLCFSIENLIPKKLIPHSNNRKNSNLGLNLSHLTYESLGTITGGVCPIH